MKPFCLFWQSGSKKEINNEKAGTNVQKSVPNDNGNRNHPAGDRHDHPDKTDHKGESRITKVFKNLL